MKAIGLTELRELLHGAPFAAWWTEHGRAVAALRDAAARRDELTAQAELMEVRAELAQRAAIDAFSRAGVAEDHAAKAAAEAQGFENRALELVGQHEAQRRRASELWVRLGGSEQALEALRAAAAVPVAAGAGRARARAPAALATAERQHAALGRAYAEEDAKRARRWDEVERAWAASFERSLLAAERALRARGIRGDAERLFGEAEERRTRAKQLRSEAKAAARDVAAGEARRAELLAAAGRELGCAAGESFLYWRRREDPGAALAVALVEAPAGSGVPGKALEIYAVGREGGVAALEPAREGAPLAGGEPARRLEEHLAGAGRGAPKKPSSRGSRKP